MDAHYVVNMVNNYYVDILVIEQVEADRKRRRTLDSMST